MFMDAGRRVGPSAGAQGDFSAFEMAEELLPFLFCRGAVFLAGPQRPSAGDERPVAIDDFFGVDGLWRRQILQLSECLSSAVCSAADFSGVVGPVACGGALPGHGDGD